MTLLVDEKYKNSLTPNCIIKFLEKLESKEPVISGKKKKIWSLNFNNYEIFVKKFIYSFRFLKYVKQTGFKSFKTAQYLLDKGVRTPEPLFFYENGLYEYFATRKINGIDLWDFLESNNSGKTIETIEYKIRELIKKFESLNLYHSDLNIRNIFVSNDLNLYLLDLDDVRFNLNERRLKKMKAKLNRYLYALSKMEI